MLAGGGGHNGSRRRQWKYELHRLSDEIGVPIRVCHYPPGASEWNKIERCLFPFISMSWRGAPLTDYQTIVDLIRNTRTRTGLSVRCQLDTNKYGLGVHITDEQMLEIKLRWCKFHKDWNYTLQPSVRNMYYLFLRESRTGLSKFSYPNYTLSIRFPPYCLKSQ
ncbi:MAG: hypothetical protein LBD58_08655 [Treponema sp.]|nr:hypothetical protein [Treponema sp.]